MGSGRRLPLVLIVLGLFLAASASTEGQDLAYPTFALGDFWEYDVEARLDTLIGIGNVSGALVASGDVRAQVTALTAEETKLSWVGTLDLQGQFTVPGETVEASITGSIATSYEELRRAPYFLPVAFNVTALLDGSVTFLITVPYSATLELNATAPPSPRSPTYPLAEEDRTFAATTDLATHLVVDFFGMTIENATDEVVMSDVRWVATASPSVEVPAGTFSGLQVSMEALNGFVPSPFQVLLPGATQVTHHSDAVGSPVLFQFLDNETEVGRAALRTYSYASSVPPPVWQNPLLIGGLLAIPIAVLLYRYMRERRRGL